MDAATIDHAMLTELVHAGAVRDAHAVANPSGWSLMVRYGNSERTLAAQRSRQVRTWRRLDSLAAYLHNLGLSQFDVDNTHFDPQAAPRVSRPDRSAALRATHEAAEYDRWFRAQVQQAIDDPRPRVSDEDARQRMAAQRDALRHRHGLPTA